MKRVRSNGGSRSRLAAEGYLLLGHYRAHRAVARALGVPEPNSGEIVSIRVAPAEADSHEPTARINDSSWRLWRSGDDVVAAPRSLTPRAGTTLPTCDWSANTAHTIGTCSGMRAHPMIAAFERIPRFRVTLVAYSRLPGHTATNNAADAFGAHG